MVSLECFKDMRTFHGLQKYYNSLIGVYSSMDLSTCKGTSLSFFCDYF
jgi:hypothetical protein